MSEFTDQVGRRVLLPETAPLRIVSTVPSQTELLYDLGLEENVVGITAYCVHPQHWLQTKTVIGGTKDLQIEKIKALKPDLILANKEENIKDQIEALESLCPIWLSDIATVEEAMEMIDQVGVICHKSPEANTIIEAINQQRDLIHKDRSPKRKAAYFIWKSPYMLAGASTFISAMMSELDLENVINSTEDRYPSLSLEQLATLNPEVLLLSSEPYPFNAAELHEIAAHFPKSIVRIIDGEYFSWYGSRMVSAFKYFHNKF